MTYLLDNFTDSDFLDFLGSLIPSVGVGVVISFFMVVIGLIIGFIIRAGSDSY